MPSRELGLPQCAKIRSGWFLLRDTLGVSDGSVEIANLGGQECRSALEVRVSLIGRDPVQRRERLLETLSLLLDDAETLQRVIPLFPLARIGQPCQVGRRNIQMARLKGCLGGRRKRFRYGVDRGGALQVGECTRSILSRLRGKSGRATQAILVDRDGRRLRQL